MLSKNLPSNTTSLKCLLSKNTRVFLSNILLTCLLTTAGCAAPAPQPDDTTAAEAADALAGPTQTGSVPAATAPRPAPPMSDPLPPQRIPVATPQPAPAGNGAAIKLDTNCKVDADCAVKNVGNCCGAYPACINKDSPTDPAAVQAQCAKDGMASVCGFREISSCSCQQGQCMPKDQSPVGGWIDDPAPPPDPVR